jgi:hypothetical protein
LSSDMKWYAGDDKGEASPDPERDADKDAVEV